MPGAGESSAPAGRAGAAEAWERPSRIDRRQLAWAAAALAILAFALYGRHAWRGGFWVDDYHFLSLFQEIGRSFGAIPDLLGAEGAWPGYRPGTTVLQVVYYLAVGESEVGHLLFGPVFIAALCWLLFVVLRMVGLRLYAAAPAALLLAVFPFLDTARLNFSAYQQTAAGAMYLGGVALALRGLSATGRAAVAWHAGALALYFAAAATHEAYLALVPGTVLLYLVVGDRRDALRRWIADLGLFAVGYLTLGRSASDTRGGEVTLDHLRTRLGEVSDGTLEVVRESLPVPDLLWGPAGIALLAVTVAGVVLAWRRDEVANRSVRQWLLVGGVALAFMLMGLAPLLPGPSDLTPVWQGFNSRVFVVASLGYAVLIVAVAFLAAIGWTALARRQDAALPVALVAIVAFAIPFTAQELSNQDDWIAAHREQERILGAIEDGIGHDMPADGPVAAVTFRHPVNVQGDALVFSPAVWDLDGAVKLLFNDDRVTGTPFLDGTRCMEDEVGLPRFAGFPPEIQIPYGSAYFVDVAGDRTIAIDDKAECERQLRRLRALNDAYNGVAL